MPTPITIPPLACKDCRQPIPLEAPVYVPRYGDPSPRCAACAEIDAKKTFKTFLPPHPCTVCGRPVHREWHLPYTVHEHCSRPCAELGRVIRSRRVPATVACASCGEYFTPPRRDARFCSATCRKRGWRQGGGREPENERRRQRRVQGSP
jgi:hypothetical protein